MTKLYSIKGLQAIVICLSLLVSSSIQAQVPSYVPTDGLVGYWPFNGNANDESGNGNDGTVNGATLTEDRNGVSNAAYSFDGVNDLIRVPHQSNLNLIGDFTISVWLEGNYQNLFNNNWVLLAKRDDGGTCCSPNVPYVFFIPFNSTNYAVPGMAYANGDYSFATPPNNITVPLSGWQNVVISNSSDNLKFFINGSLVYTTNFSSTLRLPNTSDLLIGSVNREFGAEWMNGKLDDIGTWNRALTEDEIQALYTGCNVATATIAGSVNPFTLISSDYACNNNPGSTYEWTITNGVITAGQGTSNVTVLWGEEGAGTLTVVETNTEGCSGTPATIEVTIECATTATTLDGPLGPNALTETTYTCNGSANSTFEWTISNGVITSGQGTNSVTVLWAATGLGSISVQETTNANCTGDLISINVVVIPTSIDELNESNLFLYPNPAKEEITLQTNQSSIGSLYIIVDQTGKQIASGKITGTNTTIKLDQFASGMYTIIRDGKTSQQFQVIK